MARDEEFELQQKEGEQALTAVTAVLRALELYDLNNDMVLRLLKQMATLVETHTTRTRRGMTLHADGENFFINQELLRLDLRSFNRLERLRETLAIVELNELEFHPGATPDTLAVFFQNLARSVEDPGFRPLLGEPDETFVSLRSAAGITRKGRIDENREEMALRLSVTLSLLAGDFIRRGRKGLLPSTVHMRRVVQGIVDLLDSQRDLCLAVAHRGGPETGLAGHIGRSAVFAASLARASGLPPRFAGRAALAVFISRLPLARLGERWYEAPPDVVTKAYDEHLKQAISVAGGARVSAWRLVILYEALMDTLGEANVYGDKLETSFEGRIVEVATHYDRLRAGLTSVTKGTPMPPATAIRHLGAQSVQKNLGDRAAIDAGLVRILRDLLGDVPPGSVVKTRSNRFAVVVKRPHIVEMADRHGRPLGKPNVTEIDRVAPVAPPKDYDIATALGAWARSIAPDVRPTAAGDDEPEEIEIDLDFGI